MVVTSRSTGTPCNSQAPSASKVAAIIGKAAFLEPEAASRPWSGVPPDNETIQKRSRSNRLSRRLRSDIHRMEGAISDQGGERCIDALLSGDRPSLRIQQQQR